MAMKNLATAAVVAVCIALYFASVTASPLKESAAENNAKQQRNQVIASSITAANQVSILKIMIRITETDRILYHSYTQNQSCILLL